MVNCLFHGPLRKKILAKIGSLCAQPLYLKQFYFLYSFILFVNQLRPKKAKSGLNLSIYTFNILLLLKASNNNRLITSNHIRY